MLQGKNIIRDRAKENKKNTAKYETSTLDDLCRHNGAISQVTILHISEFNSNDDDDESKFEINKGNLMDQRSADIYWSFELSHGDEWNVV